MSANGRLLQYMALVISLCALGLATAAWFKIDYSTTDVTLQSEIETLKENYIGVNTQIAAVKSIGNEGLSLAQSNRAAIDAMNEKIDRMFKKNIMR